MKRKQAYAEKSLHLGDLKPLNPNARQRTERSAAMIVDSLQRFGAARSIVVDENDTVLAGNGTVEAAGVAGIERVRVVEADGNELIAVRRRGLTEEQKAGLALADNRTAELAEWSPEMLAQIAADMPDVTKGLWSDEELAALLAKATDNGAPSISPDEARRTLAERFLVPPFSVLDARQGYWQDRKRAWLALGMQSELGRGGAPGGSPRPAAQRTASGHTARGACAGGGKPTGREDGLTWGKSKAMLHPTLNHYRETERSARSRRTSGQS